MNRKFGLIGKTVGHSFSKIHFDEKFFREGLMDCRYDLYALPNIGDLTMLLQENPDLHGLNVTVPYKEEVLPFLHSISPEAREIGAVNVIRIRAGKLEGFNTDASAFQETLTHWEAELKGQSALVLGTGGSSKAVCRALSNLGITYHRVSRKQGRADYTYADLAADPSVLAGHRLLINTTPLGMSPDTNAWPEIPFEQLSDKHLVYDLIYNPARTQFLQKAEMRGASIRNGLEMLHIQAEKSWEIWSAG